MGQVFHNFRVDLASMRLENGDMVGVENAILLQGIAHWCEGNKAEGVNYKDGRYWTYSTIEGFRTRHPYWTTKQLRRIIRNCEASGLLLSASYHADGRNRTKWYTVREDVLKLLFSRPERADAAVQTGKYAGPNGQMQRPEWADEAAQTGKCAGPNGQIQRPERADAAAQTGKCIYNEENTAKKLQQENTAGKIQQEDITTAVSVSDGTDRRQMQSVIAAWNDLDLQQITLSDPTATRYKQLRSRIRQYGQDGVLRAIEKIKDSAFLRGKNERGWVITFDWLIHSDNFPKVLEGNYDSYQRQETVPSGVSAKKTWSEIAHEMESEGWTI